MSSTAVVIGALMVKSFFLFSLSVKKVLHGLSMLAKRKGQKFSECSIINPTFIIWGNYLVIGQFNLSSVFLCFALVTINRQTLYDSDILY